MWILLTGPGSCVMEGHHKAESSVFPVRGSRREPQKEEVEKETGG